MIFNNHILLQKPPTIYALLNSYVNYGKDESEKVKISELASYGRSAIFDFDYPLTDKITNEEFETIILNHYMMRRIGFDTLTAFKLQLNVRLNAVMPIYNKMFDMLDGWDLFKDGEEISRSVTDSNTSDVTSQTSGYDVNDIRSSDNPQGKLENIRSADYVTDYSYNQTNSNVNSASKNISNGESSETIKRSPADKIRIYTELLKNRESIYDLLFKELDKLFYALID